MRQREQDHGGEREPHTSLGDPEEQHHQAREGDGARNDHPGARRSDPPCRRSHPAMVSSSETDGNARYQPDRVPSTSTRGASPPAQQLVAHLAAEHLADEGAGEVVHRRDAFGHLVGREPGAAEVSKRTHVELCALARARRLRRRPRLRRIAAGPPRPWRRTSGCASSASSTSLGDTLNPPVMMSSLSRSTIVTNPSAETSAMSPSPCAMAPAEHPRFPQGGSSSPGTPADRG